MASKRVRLAQRRRAAGFSQEQLAQRLGVERTTVVRWESAETEPRPWLRPMLAKAINVSSIELDELLADVELGEPERSDRMSYALAHPASVDLLTAAYLHERVRQLGEQYDKTPSAGLLGHAGQTHGQIDYLRQHAKNSRVRKALYKVEAESAMFVGKLVWDASQRRDNVTPMTYFRQAINASRQILDASTEAYAVLRMSFVAMYGEKDAAKGSVLAQRSAETVEQFSASLTGLALLHVAESYAMTNEPRGCERALAEADRQLDRVSADDAAAAHYSIDEFNRLAGSCYLFLAHPERAEPILRETVSALGGESKSQAIALGNLTLALIRQRKLDEAAATMHRTLDAVELTRGGGGFNVVFAAGQELRDWRGETWVQEIDDRLLGLLAAI